MGWLREVPLPEWSGKMGCLREVPGPPTVTNRH